MPHKFRNLKIWQRSMALVTQVYTLTKTFPRDEVFGLTAQLVQNAECRMQNAGQRVLTP